MCTSTRRVDVTGDQRHFTTAALFLQTRLMSSMDDLPLIAPWRRREFHAALRALIGLQLDVPRRARRTSTGVLLILLSG